MENYGERHVTVEQLHGKEVINISDGKRLGCPCDVRIDLCDGRVLALVLPCAGGFMGIGSKGDEIIIPWENIEKIGKDIILVKCVPLPKCDRHPECEKKKRFFS